MVKKSKFKIGIVGAGNIAKVHARAIQASSNSKLHSVYSRTGKNAQVLADEHGIAGHTDWNSFISDPELDAVSICSPSGNHLDYGEMAARAGKHVIVEKPIEVTLERARRFIRACQDNQVALAVIYQSRWILAIEELKKNLDQQLIGKVFMADAYIKWYRGQDYYDSGAWRGTLELDGGGVLINQAIHTIDLLQWFMGDVESISGMTATMTHERLEGEDNAVAIVKFKSGAIGVIQGSTSIQPAQPRRIELHGETGTVVLDGDDVKLLRADADNKDKKEEIKEASGASSPFSGFSYEPHKLQFEAIAEAISNGKRPLVSGEESLKSLAIVLAIYESSKTNRTVNMDEFMN